MNIKELNEEEVQNYISSDPKNEWMNFYQEKKELFNTHFYIKVVLNNAIDSTFNLPEMFLYHAIKTSKDIKIL